MTEGFKTHANWQLGIIVNSIVTISRVMDPPGSPWKLDSLIYKGWKWGDANVKFSYPFILVVSEEGVIS